MSKKGRRRAWKENLIYEITDPAFLVFVVMPVVLAGCAILFLLAMSLTGGCG